MGDGCRNLLGAAVAPDRDRLGTTSRPASTSSQPARSVELIARSVRIEPGQMQLTVMPCAARSKASDRVIPMTAAFDAE